MGFYIKSSTITVTVLLTVTAFSCSLPFFSRNQGGGAANSPSSAYQPKPAKLSGVLELQAGCQGGFYPVKLQGLFEGANVTVETQADQTGRFSLVAPPGRYMLLVSRDWCGAKQPIELEENTEHMVSIVVSETKAVERSMEIGGRLPASVLIQQKK